MTVVPLRQEQMSLVESALMRLQRVQQTHDEVAHRDILSFSLHKRLKHMVLHFYKYAGNIETARSAQDTAALRRVLVDAFIICLASANALNLRLDLALGADAIDQIAFRESSTFGGDDLYGQAVRELVLIGGQMAKAMESLDHVELGNPREAMLDLVPQLAASMLGLLGRAIGSEVEAAVCARLRAVEQRSIFASSTQ